MDPSIGSFVISETDRNYIGKSITTEIECTSVVSEVTTRDSFEIIFKEVPDMSGTNPCLADEIYYTSTVRDFEYIISYPANKLMVNIDYNQKISGCPVRCEILAAGTQDPPPDPPFVTYGTEAIFSVFTSDAQFEGQTYGIEVNCHSQVSNQSPIIQTFDITFVHDDSSSDAAIYSDCANDIISF